MENRDKIKSIPKPATNGYMAYSNHTRAILKNEQPNLTFVEISKYIANGWRNVNDEEKKKWEKKAAEQTIDYWWKVAESLKGEKKRKEKEHISEEKTKKKKKKEEKESNKEKKVTINPLTEIHKKDKDNVSTFNIETKKETPPPTPFKSPKDKKILPQVNKKTHANSEQKKKLKSKESSSHFSE
jgi:isopenicillin N synthase-like dioxygenase